MGGRAWGPGLGGPLQALHVPRARPLTAGPGQYGVPRGLWGQA